MIPFNKPHLTGKETAYIEDAVMSGKIAGNGKYTKLCHQFFKDKFRFQHCLLTTSCTDALEMCALLADIQPGDEVILPSYTFVSTANAFILRGAKLVFTDSRKDHPGIDEAAIEDLITSRTKAIVVVHYAGVACDMDVIMDLSDKYKVMVIEDAAQAIDSYYTNRQGERKPLGGIGHLSAFSFHETKNVISGEGGLLVINDEQLVARAEILWEKGTDRSAFFRGEVDKYGWVDIGSSFLPSEVVAAFLYAQLEQIEDIQAKRKNIWERYFQNLQYLKALNIQLPIVPEYASNNAHMFYLVCESEAQRSSLIESLKAEGILSVFHYLSLHKSKFFEQKHDGRELIQSDRYSETLLRLPLYYEFDEDLQNQVLSAIQNWFDQQKK